MPRQKETGGLPFASGLSQKVSPGSPEFEPPTNSVVTKARSPWDNRIYYPGHRRFERGTELDSGLARTSGMVHAAWSSR